MARYFGTVLKKPVDVITSYETDLRGRPTGVPADDRNYIPLTADFGIKKIAAAGRNLKSAMYFTGPD